jgi:hypothetical protein
VFEVACEVGGYFPDLINWPTCEDPNPPLCTNYPDPPGGFFMDIRFGPKSFRKSYLPTYNRVGFDLTTNIFAVERIYLQSKNFKLSHKISPKRMRRLAWTFVINMAIILGF